MTCPRILPNSSATSESAGTDPSDARIASTILASAVLPNAASVAAVIAARTSGSSAGQSRGQSYVGGDNAEPIPPAKTSSPGWSSLRTQQSECGPTHSPAGRHELSPRGGKGCSSRAGAATAAPADEPDERVELSGRGRTKVARPWNTRRRAATSDTCEPAPLCANPHGSAPSSRSW